MLDEYTFFKQKGLSGTLEEMRARYLQDITGLDTVGEQILKAYSVDQVRAMLNVIGPAGALSVSYDQDGIPYLDNVNGSVQIGFDDDGVPYLLS